MTSLRRLTGKTSTDAERGKLILESTSLIRNNGAAIVEDVIEDLLRSGAWQTYTFPDGTHHEWLDREFDYFVSAQQFDWDKIKRNITKPGVLCLVADSSGRSPNPGNHRRALDEIKVQFPHVTMVKLVSDHVRDIAANKTKRRQYERNGNVTRAVEGSPWVFRVKRSSDATIDDRADAIVARLLDDPALAKRVYQKLHASDSARRYRGNGMAKGKQVIPRARGI